MPWSALINTPGGHIFFLASQFRWQVEDGEANGCDRSVVSILKRANAVCAQDDEDIPWVVKEGWICANRFPKPRGLCITEKCKNVKHMLATCFIYCKYWGNIGMHVKSYVSNTENIDLLHVNMSTICYSYVHILFICKRNIAHTIQSGDCVDDNIVSR